MLEVMYENANDDCVCLRKVYANGTDEYAYVDEDCKVKVEADELENAFYKGVIIIDADGVMYKPVHCAIVDKVVTLTYVTTDSTTATTAKLATVKSH